MQPSDFPAPQQSVLLNLVVIRCADLDRSESFYRALGLSFTRHRHGAGPEHLSCELGPLVFEIYPGGADSPSPSRIGFRVPSVSTIPARSKAELPRSSGPSVRSRRSEPFPTGCVQIRNASSKGASA